MRGLITILFLLMCCNLQAQNYTQFGAARIQDTSNTKGSIKVAGQVILPYYATSSTANFLAVNSAGYLYLTSGGGGGGTTDSTRFSTVYRNDTGNQAIRAKQRTDSLTSAVRFTDTIQRVDADIAALETAVLDTAFDLRAAINTKQSALGYTPENVANKVQNINSPNATTYPSTAAVNNALLPYVLKSDSLIIFATPKNIMDSANSVRSAIPVVTGKVNYSDSLVTFATPKQLKDTAAAIRSSFPAGTDTTGLSNRINQKQNYSDTTTYDGTKYNISVAAAPKQNFTDTNSYDATKYNLTVGLAPKLNSSDTAGLSGRINLKLNSSDTASLSNRINLKLNITDTASLSNRINLKLNSFDTAGLSTRINLKLNANDTASLSNRINLKLTSTDTAGLSNRINLKLNSSDTAGLSGRINLKQNITDTTTYDGTKYDIVVRRQTNATITTTTTLTIAGNTGASTIYQAITTQVGALTIANPTGTFTEGECLEILVKGASAIAITFGSAFEATGTALPTTTTAGKTLMMYFQYNNSTSSAKWQIRQSDPLVP